MKNVQIRRQLTWADKALIGGLLLLSLGSAPVLWSLRQEGRTVQIETAGRVYQTLPLHASHTLAVPGPLGKTIVAIDQGTVHVVDSPCRAKICVKTGEISHTGQLIVCIPNQVVVRVTGAEAPAYDAITQ
jgi:hypothetical protein